MQAMKLNNTAYYGHILHWIHRILSYRGITTEYLKQINASLEEVLSEELDTYDNLLFKPYFDMHDSIDYGGVDVEAAESFVDGQYATQIQTHVDYLVDGERKEAIVHIKQLQHEMSTKDILIQLIQPSQYEIGRLWEINEINVAQEHVATAINQHLISELIYPELFQSNEDYKASIICFSPGTELHEMGIRMLSDLFTVDGWNAIFLGSNIPLTDASDVILVHNPDVIALSATLITSVETITEFITDLRNQPWEGKIIVGGYPFNLDENLWKLTGADGYARSADEAIEICNTWISG